MMWSTGPNKRTCRRAFTLIELVLVLALLVVITSLALPAMSGFVRGQALNAEARRLVALTHAGQGRAVSEGMPMMLWIDEKQGAYGLEAETPPQTGDPKAEKLTLHESLQIAVEQTGSATMTTFHNLPAIRFLADGSIDENSPQKLRVMNADTTRWLLWSAAHGSYEINDTDK
ncbi:MAG TPA: prepilin-type N-terminal cleavage/methylation domain-containing protein [Dongiaceae bacterium]|nr:prepilin-type N-terminal cleavage/methylation domain-containing protein [Dongiaceae bacterium]